MKKRSIIAIALLMCITSGCGSSELANSVGDISETTQVESKIERSNTESITSNTESIISNGESSIISDNQKSENSDGNSTCIDVPSANQNSNSESSIQSSVQSSIQSSVESSQTSKQESSQTSQTSQTSQASKQESVQATIYATSITLSKHELNLTVGSTATLTATISPSNTTSKKITWYWENDAIISIDKNGTVTAKKAGTTTITVKTENGKTDTCKVTVKATQTSQPSQSSSSQSSKVESSKNIDPLYLPYEAPYDSSIPYDWDAVIADLRKVGEEQYGMTWEESLWVKNKGQDYGSKYDEEWGYFIDDGHYHGCAGYVFPESTDDSCSGEHFREGCLYLFKQLELQAEKRNSNMSDYLFKIVVEQVDTDEYWVYLLYT